MITDIQKLDRLVSVINTHSFQLWRNENGDDSGASNKELLDVIKKTSNQIIKMVTQIQKQT